jgi:Family of unknown function (DUF6474)
MGLFKKRKSRATRKAEAKALKEKAKLEAKLGAKNERKRNKAEARSQRKLEKAQISALKAEEKANIKLAEKAARDPFSVASVRKYLGVARVLIPVLTPLIYRAATYVRGQIDTRRAEKLGVGVEELGEYSGHGAKLSARIVNAESSTDRLIEKHGDDAETKKFAAATRERLTDLDTAVRTAELMPAPRRRSAHQAISGELAGIEADLLTRLGVR